MTALLAEADGTKPADFLAFLDARPDHERWELIDGQALMQASATLVHAILAMNIVRVVNEALEARGSSWVAIENSMVDLTSSSAGNMYVPDVMVIDADEIELGQNVTTACRLVAEIVSPSDERRSGRGLGRKIDVKLDRYRNLPSCDAILIVEQNVLDVKTFLRGPNGWTEHHGQGPDAELSIPAVGLRCRLRDIYARTPLTRPA